VINRPLRSPWLFLAVAIALPLVELLTGGYLLSITYGVELFLMLAIGLNVVVGFTGLLDLGYVAFYAVGAYTYALLASPQLYDITHRTLYFLVPNNGAQGFHVSMWLILPLAGIMASVFGVLVGFPTLRLRGDYLAIVTLGFGEITRIFANNLDEPINITNGPRGVYDVDPIWVGGYSFGTSHQVLGFTIPPFLNYYYLLLLVILLTIFLVGRLAGSRVGRAWAAIREDELAAEAGGINTRNLKLLAYASGGFFGGMAGAIFAAGQHFIDPGSFGFFFSILVLCMVVVGGMGSIPGVILGSVVTGGLYFLTGQFGSYRVLIFGVLLVVVIILRPAGLLPSGRRKRELERVELEEGAIPPLAASAPETPGAP
jgi:branched-chain amino acid transport system permease protein